MKRWCVVMIGAAVLAAAAFASCGDDDDEDGGGQLDSGATTANAETTGGNGSPASGNGGNATPGASPSGGGGTAPSAGGAVVEASEEQVSPGGEVTVVVNVDPPDGKKLGAWTVDITYDPALLTPLSCSGSGLSVCNDKYRATVVRLVGVSLEGVEGELGKVTFKAAGAAGSQSAVSIEATNCATPDAQPIDCSGAAGSVTVR